MTAPSGNGLRGDYSVARADFTVDQNWPSYTDADHRLWRALYARQSILVREHACAEFLDGLALTDAAAQIPDLEMVSKSLEQATGWRLVAVPGLIPDQPFFELLAARRFPVTVWLRTPAEIEYLVEPDIFHDFFGHVPMLYQPEFADYVQQYGRQGLAAMQSGSLRYLARVYWYTVEFGLIRTPQGLRAFGAGILSSPGETVYALHNPRPRRLRFELQRCMRTRYQIDAFQQTYFVVDSLAELAQAITPDLSMTLARLRALPDLSPEFGDAGDDIIKLNPSALGENA